MKFLNLVKELLKCSENTILNFKPFNSIIIMNLNLDSLGINSKSNNNNQNSNKNKKNKCRMNRRINNLNKHCRLHKNLNKFKVKTI